MKVIVPCCGKSSRFPNMPPKWMLPAQDGRPMVALAVEGLSLVPGSLCLAILKEHNEQFHVELGIRQIFGQDITVVILDEPTKSQAETVARTIEMLQIREPVFVKDSDNFFRISDLEQKYDYLCTDSLNNYDLINPRNKSYLQVDQFGLVQNIKEKEVISDLFNVGGYFFSHPEIYLEYYKRLAGHRTAWQAECYISDVIGAMLLDGLPFKTRGVSGYQDWGTVSDWRRKLLQQKTFFVSLDGFVFTRGSLYFKPHFGDVRPNEPAVLALREAAKRGEKIIYLSIRPKVLDTLTKKQLAASGLPEGQVVYDCPLSVWGMVTAPHSTLPFQTSFAKELDPLVLDIWDRLVEGDV
jgi:hypothetical protein